MARELPKIVLVDVPVGCVVEVIVSHLEQRPENVPVGEECEMTGERRTLHIALLGEKLLSICFHLLSTWISDS